jgi:hypothetical protein
LAWARAADDKPGYFILVSGAVNDPANAAAGARLLTTGIGPDWQPAAPFPPA